MNFLKGVMGSGGNTGGAEAGGGGMMGGGGSGGGMGGMLGGMAKSLGLDPKCELHRYREHGCSGKGLIGSGSGEL